MPSSIAYSPEIAELICARVARGDPLERICTAEGMPSIRTLKRWLARYEDFATQYARARRMQVELRTSQVGRPTAYSPEVVEAICEGIMSGRSVYQICALDGMPAPTTVYRWLAERSDFAERYANAKQIQAEVLADQMLDLADDQALDASDKRARFAIRKWLITKLKPKKYGDRAVPEPEPSVRTLSDEELARHVDELVAQHVAAAGLKLVPVDATVILPADASAEALPNEEEEDEEIEIADLG